jgi:hypothetical protein
VATALSRMVLRPVSQALADRRLLIVADGALQAIPFGALPDPSTGRPLLVSHPLVYAPSASTLAVLRQRARPSSTGVEVAILADPVFSTDDARFGGGRKRASPLPADLLRSLRTPGSHLPPLTATRQRPRRSPATPAPPTPSPRWVRCQPGDRAGPAPLRVRECCITATHALLDTRRPELSGVLSPTAGEPVDGFLSWRISTDAPRRRAGWCPRRVALAWEGGPRDWWV